MPSQLWRMQSHHRVSHPTTPTPPSHHPTPLCSPSNKPGLLQFRLHQSYRRLQPYRCLPCISMYGCAIINIYGCVHVCIHTCPVLLCAYLQGGAMQMVACYLETVQASRHDNFDRQHHGVYILDSRVAASIGLGGHLACRWPCMFAQCVNLAVECCVSISKSSHHIQEQLMGPAECDECNAGGARQSDKATSDRHCESH